MKRQMIKIDEDKCNGCGLCAEACHEGAIGMVNGKAKLLREDYCDGLGNCLPVCPTGAISFEMREAPAFNKAEAEAAVRAALKESEPYGCPGIKAKTIKHSAGESCACGGHSEKEAPEELPCGCPGTHSKTLRQREDESCDCGGAACHEGDSACGGGAKNVSRLSQWPVQIKLVPVNAPYFNNAHLLVAADCTAFAYGDFHNQFIKNKITLIGCPKLDMGDYSEKLTEILKHNNIKSVTVARMEVPCCGGLEYAVKTALQRSGKFIPWRIVTITTDGEISDD